MGNIQIYPLNKQQVMKVVKFVQTTTAIYDVV